MLRRARTTLSILAMALFLAAPGAQATQATTSDLTDYIVRLGGWFLPADSTAAPSYHYWVQVSYALQSTASGSKPAGTTTSPTGTGTGTATANAPAATPANTPATGSSGSNITTLVKTQSMMQAELGSGGITSSGTVGPACSNGMTVTETVTLDLRELKAASAPTPDSTTIEEGRTAKNPRIALWKVRLQINGGKKLIRINTTQTPPTCKDSSGNPVSLPGGNPVQIATSQIDQDYYDIEFADADQAKYLQMLINSLVPSLNPPRPNVAPLP